MAVVQALDDQLPKTNDGVTHLVDLVDVGQATGARLDFAYTERPAELPLVSTGEDA